MRSSFSPSGCEWPEGARRSGKNEWEREEWRDEGKEMGVEGKGRDEGSGLGGEEREKDRKGVLHCAVKQEQDHKKVYL